MVSCSHRALLCGVEPLLLTAARTIQSAGAGFMMTLMRQTADDKHVWRAVGPFKEHPDEEDKLYLATAAFEALLCLGDDRNGVDSSHNRTGIFWWPRQQAAPRQHRGCPTTDTKRPIMAVSTSATVAPRVSCFLPAGFGIPYHRRNGLEHMRVSRQSCRLVLSRRARGRLPSSDGHPACQ